MKSEVKFKVRSLNFVQPVGKFTSDFIKGEKICCHIKVAHVMRLIRLSIHCLFHRISRLIPMGMHIPARHHHNEKTIFHCILQTQMRERESNTQAFESKKKEKKISYVHHFTVDDGNGGDINITFDLRPFKETNNVVYGSAGTGYQLTSSDGWEYECLFCLSLWLSWQYTMKKKEK